MFFGLFLGLTFIKETLSQFLIMETKGQIVFLLLQFKLMASRPGPNLLQLYSYPLSQI